MRLFGTAAAPTQPPSPSPSDLRFIRAHAKTVQEDFCANSGCVWLVKDCEAGTPLARRTGSTKFVPAEEIAICLRQGDSGGAAGSIGVLGGRRGGQHDLGEHGCASGG